ncbi:MULTISPECIES: S24 family peptidase [Achromobacter]|uniref:S24 family peptidase n=1 Tax=Achromobacter spanius TaxID=217203 RepID=A0ABY8GU76_9BURK|nr:MULTISPECIES: S24 family peptidase [Achromobacter]WAI82566.1 S24 family peptidase [Achromobacter spanius]WEX92651.1 S24 family peptidase [Achromobacter sp. SS2-2022]WFP08195.1 S24 family peptidase [Achromobacter spanius]
MTIQEIRRANLRAWVQQNGAPSKEKSYFSQVLSGTAPIGERAARRLERDYRMGEGFLDTPPHHGDSKPIPDANPPSTWPFESIAEAEVRALPPTQLSALEGAIALAIAQLKLGINVVPPAQPRPQPATRGALVDMGAADDPFPMRIGGAQAAPWEGGHTTLQAKRDSRIRISTQTGVVANVGPGEPRAVNDKFEKVPEMADVRLAAGDGIENLAEEETGTVQFRRSFLRSIGAGAGKARVVYAKGDSMEPIIRDGAALLVVPNENLALQDIAAGGVYAINYDGKMIVKTVTRDRLTKSWVARSFNPTYPDIPLENGTSVRVLGQVVWAGARLRDDEAGQWMRT